MIATHNSLSENIRNASACLLNKALSTAIDLQGQMKQAHWNLRGPGFIAVHKLFDNAAALAYEQGDALAERAGALGSEAAGTIQVAAKATALPPYPLKLADAPAHIEAVCAALAAYSAHNFATRLKRVRKAAMSPALTCSPGFWERSMHSNG